MAKPLSPKSKLIREALKANPKLGNTELAELINSSDARKEDKIKVTSTDVGNQKQALKELNGKAKKASKPKKALAAKAANKPSANGAVAAATSKPNAAGPAELIDRVFDL